MPDPAFTAHEQEQAMKVRKVTVKVQRAPNGPGIRGYYVVCSVCPGEPGLGGLGGEGTIAYLWRSADARAEAKDHRDYHRGRR